MTTRTRLALVTAGFLGVGLMTVALQADAQQPAPPPPPAAGTPPAPPQAFGRSERERPKFSPADRAAFFDARIAAIHAGLQLTPDQEKLWSPVETAMRDMAKDRAAQREAMRSEPRPADPVQRLERMSERTIARGQALKKLADAAGPLYATLTDAQKHRLPLLMGGMHHRFAMMHEGRGGGERGGMGWQRGGRGPEDGRMGGWRGRERDRDMMGRDERDFDAR
jgi:hypothetical protein